MHKRSRKILGMRRLDMQRAQRKETVYEKKYRHAESTNKGDGEKRTARSGECKEKRSCIRRSTVFTGEP
jgi:hypothetical protein